MNRMPRYMFVAFLAMLTVLALTLEIQGNANNGRPDSDMDYRCGCHGTPSSTSVVTIEASAATVYTGGDLEVTVTVSTTEQAEGEWIGAFLVTKIDGSGAQPAEKNWTITEDPNGGTFNYVQKAADADGGAIYVWKLTAPPEPGQYDLIARENHGGSGALTKAAEAGVTITVEADPTPPPDGNGNGDGGGDGGDGGGNGGGDGAGDGGDGNGTGGGTGGGGAGPSLPGQDVDFFPMTLGLIGGIVVVVGTLVMRDAK